MINLLQIKQRFTILRDIKHLSYILFGFILFIFYSIFNKRKGERLYSGYVKFYATVQSETDGLLKKVAVNFFENPIGYMVRDYFYLKANIGRDKLSTGTIQEYSDESLLGYGAVNYAEVKEAGAPLEKQQRGLMIPILKQCLSENPGGLKTVVEIGCGNGDVIQFLAEQHPNYVFCGVDFFIKNATLKHNHQKNLSFVKGYALDLLEAGQLKGDIVFGSSTFCVFTPKELERYLKAIYSAGFSEVILSEPIWGGYVQTNDMHVISKHVGGSVWFHNYCGYLRQAKFDIKQFDFFHYKQNKSVRPDIFVSILRASRQGHFKSASQSPVSVFS